MSAKVRAFELFHGVALVKLLRSDRPVTLRMFETNPQEAWSTYKLNDTVFLLVKYRTDATPSKTRDTTTWHFGFGSGELERLRSEEHFVVLVCGRGDLDLVDTMQTCLLQPKQVETLLDLSQAHQSLTVKAQPQKWLQVSSQRGQKEIKIPRGALADWIVPGG